MTHQPISKTGICIDDSIQSAKCKYGGCVYGSKGTEEVFPGQAKTGFLNLNTTNL
jgi:hypothetical protein